MVAIECNEEGTMLEHWKCLYLTCVCWSFKCTQNGQQCTRPKSRILIDVEHALLFPLSLSFVLFLLFVTFMCCLLSKVSQSYGSIPSTIFFKFKLFFSYEFNAMSVSLPNVRFNAHEASNSN